MTSEPRTLTFSLLESGLEAARDALFLLSRDGTILSWNQGARTIFGHERARAVGRSLGELLLAPSRREEAHKWLDEARSIGATACETTLRRADESEASANLAIRFVRDGAAGFEGYMVSAWEERERGSVRQAVIQDQRVLSMIEVAPDAMVVVDADGLIASVNGMTETLFGYPRKELLGCSVDVLVPERFRGSHPAARAGYARDPHPRPMGAGLELYARRKDGTEFPVEISLSPVPAIRGIVIAAIRDISARKRTETALRAANRELDAFCSAVAHDLRAPLRGMNGFAQALLEDYKDKLDADGADYLNEIRQNATRMGSLIDALLSLSRVARSPLRPEMVNLTTLARSLAAQLAEAESDRSVAVMVEDHLVAEADLPLVRALLSNLLGNAWKFTSKVAEPRIEVGARANSNGEQVFFVRDNGAGFDMAHADKLFGAFQRLHTVGEFPGTGIGLATAQRIVHRHGGRIWAEGKVDAGAVFSFTLQAPRTSEAT